MNYADQLAKVAERLIEAVRKVGVPRLIVVGGCGSLEFSPGGTLLKSGYWPEKLSLPAFIPCLLMFLLPRHSDQAVSSHPVFSESKPELP